MPKKRVSRSSSIMLRSASSSKTGNLIGMEFERLEWDQQAKRSKLIDTVLLPADDVILAIGQENAFPVD